MRKLLALVVFLILVSSAYAIELPSPVNVKSVDANVIITGTGTINGTVRAADTVKLKILTFRAWENQEVLGIAETLSIGSRVIQASHEEDGYGNRYAVFFIGNIGMVDFTYTINARLRTDSDVGVRDYNMQGGIGSNADYAKPTKHMESNDASIRSLAFTIMDEAGELANIVKAAEFVNDYITYDLNYFEVVLKSTEVLDAKRGVCAEYSNLAGALLRAKGIPVKYIVGQVYNGENWGAHAWLEAYVPNFGWMPVDATYLEAGAVDGTHIILAKVDDAEKAADEITATETLSVEIEKSYEVVVNSFEEFSGLTEIAADKTPVDSGERFDFSFSVKSRHNEMMITPVQLSMHENFSQKNAEWLVVLSPDEEKELSLNTTAPLTGGKSYDYGFRIVDWDNRYEDMLRVNASAEEREAGANIIVKSVVPIIDGNVLKISIVLENLGREEGIVDLNLSRGGGEGSADLNMGSSAEELMQASVPANSAKTIKYEISGFEYGEYVLTIKLPDAIEVRKIDVAEGIAEERIASNGGSEEGGIGTVGSDGGEANSGAGLGDGKPFALDTNLILIAVIGFLSVAAVVLAIRIFRR